MPEDHYCIFRKGKSWWTFVYLEERLTNISRYVTFSESNKKAWGEELASSLILSGAAVDTFFQRMKECPYIKNNQSVIDVENRVTERKKKGRYQFWDINDYRDALNPIYELSKNSVDVPFGLEYFGEIKPFEEFDKKRIPTWWTAYNNLKHDYYEKIQKKANLGNIINCLAGLLVLNTLHKCSQESLCYYRVIRDKYDQVNPYHLANELKKSMIGYRRASQIFEPYIQTKQFVMKLREDK